MCKHWQCWEVQQIEIWVTVKALYTWWWPQEAETCGTCKGMIRLYQDCVEWILIIIIIIIVVIITIIIIINKTWDVYSPQTQGTNHYTYLRILKSRIIMTLVFAFTVDGRQCKPPLSQSSWQSLFSAYQRSFSLNPFLGNAAILNTNIAKPSLIEIGLSGDQSSVCHLLSCWFFLGLSFYPDDGSDMFLRNVGWLSADYTAL
jgi:hypothetical protein